MTVEDMGGGQAPAPVKLTYKLDGSVSKNMMAGRGGGAPTEQVSKAMWAGNNLVVTTTTGAGEEKRTFSMDGGDLVVETSAPARNGGAPNVTKVTYKRYERGFGGWSRVPEVLLHSPALHPGALRCSSLKYSRYSRSSRLARRAHRRPRC